MSSGREANPYARMQFGEETLNRGSDNLEVFFIHKRPRESPTEPYRADRYIWAARGGTTPRSVTEMSQPLTVGEGEGPESVMVAAGPEQSLVLRTDGSVWGWGVADSYELTDTVNPSDGWQKIPIDTGITDMVHIAVGARRGAGVKSDGTVWLWGRWLLGSPDTVEMGSGFIPQPEMVVGIENATKVYLGVESDEFFVLLSDGTLLAWGENSTGALGVGNTTDQRGSSMIPVLLSNVAEVYPSRSTSNQWTMFMKTDGSVWTCGKQLVSQLGLPSVANLATISTPQQLDTPPEEELIGAARAARCGFVLRDNGIVYGWGESINGQFHNVTGIYGSPQATGFSNVVDIKSGNFQTLLKKSDQTIWTCGKDPDCELGYEPTGDSGLPFDEDVVYPERLVGISGQDIHGIAMGRDHTILVREDCQFWGWGNNTGSQVGGYGNEDSEKLCTPSRIVMGVEVDPFSGSTDIRAGGDTSVSRLSDGSPYGWGSNASGLLGEFSTAAVPLESFGSAADYQLGDAHVTVLRGDGSVWGAGDNSYNQLGIGEDAPVSSDTLVEVLYDADSENQYLPMPQTIEEIAVGSRRVFARAADGSLWGWGNNASGWLGTGFLMSPPAHEYFPNRIVRQPAIPGDPSPPPEDMRPLEDITRVWANLTGSWAMDSGGEIWMWGEDHVLAESDTSAGVQVITDSTAPIPLSEFPTPNPISSVAEVDFGRKHAIILKTDGTLFAFAGDNTNGAIGTGSGDVGSGTVMPKVVSGISGVSQIACGEYHTAILLSDGTVWCAGLNLSGQLGDDTGVDSSPEFVQVVGGEQGGEFLEDITDIAAGDGHTLAIDSTGSVWAWGEGSAGQLGDGERLDSYIPVGVGLRGDIIEFNACVPADGNGGGSPDMEDWPLDPLLPEMEPVSGIPIPNLNMDVGIDHPPTLDFEIPDFEMPDLDPDFEMPDFHIPEFHIPDFNMPMDGFDFPDFSMDDCFAPMDFGGMCDPMPGTGSGTGGYNTDGTKNRKKGRVRGGGESSRKDTFDTRTCFTGPVYDAIVDLCDDMGLDPDSLVIRADCEGVTVDKCFDKGTEKWDALWYMCDLCDAQPIDEGSGLIEITPIIPLPKTHLAHEDGSRGEVAHATTTAAYTQPAVDSNVSVTMDSTSILSSNRAVVIEGGGYYKVVSITSGTVAVLKNLGYPGGATAGTTVAVGKKVMLGGSTAVPPPSTYLTASFTQPAVNTNVTVSVGKSGFLTAGDSVEIVLAGFYEVISTPSATTVVLKNKGLAGSTAPGALVLVGSQVKKEELTAISTTAYTLTTASFTQPAQDATVEIVVGNTGYFDEGETTYITEAGYYEITDIANSTHMTVKNLNYVDSASPTTVVAAGKKVTPEVVEYAALQEGFWPIFTLERDYDAGDMYYAVEVYKVEVDETGLEVGSIWSKLAIVPGPFSMDPSNIYRIIAPDDMTEEQAEALAIKRARDYGRMSYRVTLTTLYGGSAFRLREKLRLLRPSLSPPLDHTLMIYNITHDISETGKFTILEARFFDSLLVNTEADLAEPPPEEFEIPLEEVA